MHFNPPPGWPAQPPGWIPPAGWQPDPSWPPAPDAWTWWVSEPVLPTTDLGWGAAPAQSWEPAPAVAPAAVAVAPQRTAQVQEQSWGAAPATAPQQSWGVAPAVAAPAAPTWLSAPAQPFGTTTLPSGVVPVSRRRDGWFWLLLLQPLLRVVVVLGALVSTFEVPTLVVWLALVGLGVGLALADARSLRADGWSTDGWGWVTYAIPLVYIVRRMQLTGVRLWPVLVWFAAVGLAAASQPLVDRTVGVPVDVVSFESSIAADITEASGSSARVTCPSRLLAKVDDVITCTAVLDGETFPFDVVVVEVSKDLVYWDFTG